MAPLFFSTRLARAIDRNDGLTACRLLGNRTFRSLEGPGAGMEDCTAHEQTWLKVAFERKSWNVFPLFLPDMTDMPDDARGEPLLLVVGFLDVLRHAPDPVARLAIFEALEGWSGQCGGPGALCAVPVRNGLYEGESDLRRRSLPLHPLPFGQRMEWEEPGFLETWQASLTGRQLEEALPASPIPGMARKPSRL